MIIEGVEVTWYDDDPPILVEGSIDGRVFALKIWKQDWEFRVADAVVDLRMGIEPIYIERSPLGAEPTVEKRRSLVDKIKTIIISCVANYRAQVKGSTQP